MSSQATHQATDDQDIDTASNSSNDSQSNSSSASSNLNYCDPRTPLNNYCGVTPRDSEKDVVAYLCQVDNKDDHTEQQCATTSTAIPQQTANLSGSNASPAIELQCINDPDLRDVAPSGEGACNEINPYLLNYYNQNKMLINYGREIICILALILTTYATFHISSPKLARAPLPKKFFGPGSFVEDWPTGALTTLQNKVTATELSFVLFYAPWCAESHNVRQPYERVAKLFYREAHFAAINCWQPGGECRHQYGKVMMWPVLMAYLPNGLAVQYRGTWTESTLSRFVRSMMNPLIRLTDTDQIVDEMASHDALVVAFIDMKRNTSEYHSFFKASVKWLERDPFQELAFATVTGQSAEPFGVDLMPTIRMYLWNETLEYDGNWNQTDISKWIIDNMHQVSLWMSPSGVKSASLAPYLKLGPVLILFTPRNYYTDSIDSYEMVRQIGLEYFNCLNDPWVMEIARSSLSNHRRQNYKKHIEITEKCLHRTFERKSKQSCEANSSVYSVTVSNVLNGTIDDKYNNNQFCNVKPISNTQCDDSCFTDDNDCSFMHRKIVPVAQKMSGINNRYQRNSEYDLRAPQNLGRLLLAKKCHYYDIGHESAPPLFFDIGTEEDLKSLTGMACKVNRTLSFISMDSLLYHTFAERLGVDILKQPNKTTALIIDHENESSYILKQPLSTTSLVKFVTDFTKRKLVRHKKVKTKHDHLHLYNNKANEMPEKERSTQTSSIRIRELTSDSFERLLLISNKTIVAMFYSTQCALCGVMSHALLTVSNLLSELNSVSFVRVEGDKNDFSWHYSMEMFPSLIVFPSERSAESRIFPSKMKVSTPNILGFVLANLDRPTRLQAFVSACKHSNKIASYTDCLGVLRREVTEHIAFSLRQWRKFPHQRSHILRRLHALKQFYLQLFKIDKVSDFDELQFKMNQILRIWHTTKEV